MSEQKEAKGPTYQAGQGKLQTRLTVWVLIPIMVLLVAVAALSLTAFQRLTAELVYDRNLDKTRLLANQLQTTLEDFQRELLLNASQEAVLSGIPALQQEYLTAAWDAGRLSRFDQGVILVNSQGKVQAAVPSSLRWISEDFSEFSFLSQALELGQPVFSGMLQDQIIPGDVLALAYPLEDPDGRRTGAITALFRAERMSARTSDFYQSIWGLYIGRETTAYLVDGSGRVIFHTDTFYIGENFSGQPHIQTLLSGQSGVERIRGVDNQLVVASYSPVTGTSWGLVSEESWADLTRPSQPYAAFLLGLLGLSVLIPAVILLIGSRQITRPLDQLSRAAREIAAGDFSQEIQVNTGDELEELAVQFNRMSRDLKTSYAALERQVEERTRELAALNKIAAEVSGSWDLDEILEAALEEALQLMDLDRGAAFLLEGNQQLILRAQKGFSMVFQSSVSRLQLTDSLASLAFQEGQPAARKTEDYPAGALKKSLGDEGVLMVISVPLEVRGTTLGALNLTSRTPRELTASDRTLLAAIGQQAGVAVENTRLYHKMEEATAAAERTRLARELHDAVSQTLFSASMLARALPRLWEQDPEAAREKSSLLQKLTQAAQAEMRSLLLELKPSVLEKTALGDLITQLCLAAAGRSNLEPQVRIGPIPSIPVPTKLALYRITQEAINNAIKHADASRLEILLAEIEKGKLQLIIEDNGRGFDTARPPVGDHFGLENMRERANEVGAVLSIESQPGKGTLIRISWQDEEDEHD